MQNLKIKSKTYTKKDVAKRVAELRNEKVYIAEQWTDSIFSALREIMMQADPELRIEVRDFGVFEVKLTKSKPKARNPRTGETIYVPPRRKTHFKPSKLLKNFLQQPIDSDFQGDNDHHGERQPGQAKHTGMIEKERPDKTL
jgi:integration host factor subunit beta